MSRALKILLYVLLYLMLFFAAAGIMTYTMDITVLSDIKLQLYIGVAALIICLILIFVLVISAKREPKSLDEEQEDAVKQPSIENRFTVNVTPANIPVNQMNTEEIIEDTIMDLQPVNPELANQQFHQSENNEVIVDAQEVNNAEELKEDSEFEQETDLAIYAREESENNSDSKTEEKSEEKPVCFNSFTDRITEPATRKISDDLSQTQVIYIDSSSNSYINTAGLPQLVVTDKVDLKNIRKTIDLQQKESKNKELNDEIIEDKEYLLEERRERLNSILEKAVLFALIFLLIIGLYWFYSKFIG